MGVSVEVSVGGIGVNVGVSVSVGGNGVKVGVRVAGSVGAGRSRVK